MCICYDSHMSKRLRLSIAITIIVTVIAVAATLFATQYVGSLEPATCLSDHCFCEEPSDSGLVQIVNSFTSLAFVIVGVWGLLVASRLKSARLEKRLIGVFAAVAVFIGLSSFFYHGTLTFLGQFLDIFSMYVFGTLLILGALLRRGYVKPVIGIVLFIAVNIALGYVQYVYPDSRRILFALILIPGIILEFVPIGKPGYDRKYLYLGIMSLIVAYGIWSLDQNGILCWPDSVLQGHGLWHILTAVAVGMVMLHYRRTGKEL